MKRDRYSSIWFSAALAAADGLFFGLTSPAQVIPLLLIIGFGLLILTAFWLFYNLQKALAFYAPWLRRQRRLSALLTGGVAALIALQSVGQLTTRDGFLIPLAALSLYVYFGCGKRTANDS